MGLIVNLIQTGLSSGKLPGWANPSPGVVNNGTLGSFQRDIHYTPSEFPLPSSAGAQPIYRPADQPAKEESRGAVVYIAGAYGNHTAFGQLPTALANNGWWTNIMPFRNWDDPFNAREVTGRWVKGQAMASSWERVLQRSTQDLVTAYAQANPGRPIFLGGFSMGGASSILNYISWPQGLRDLVTGLILFGPCFDVPKLDDHGPVIGAAVRHFYLGGYLMIRGRDMVRADPYVFDPEVAPHVEVQTKRPIAGVYASAAYIRRCREAIDEITRRGGDPKPVLMIHGAESDTTVLPQSFQRVRRAFPNTTEVVLEGGLHQVLLGNRRREAHRAVEEFLG